MIIDSMSRKNDNPALSSTTVFIFENKHFSYRISFVDATNGSVTNKLTNSFIEYTIDFV